MSRRYSRGCSRVLIAALLFAMVPTGPFNASANSLVPVKIAVAVPITAGAEVLGAGVRDGVRLAVAEYGARLASAGVTVTVTVRDDKGDPSKAASNAHGVIADSSIVGVVGHLNSGCSIPAARIYAQKSLAMVTPSSTNPSLTQLGLHNVFRTVATDAKQGSFAADVACSKFRLRKAYIVDDSEPYGEGLASGFRSRFEALGGTVAGRAKTSDTQTHFSALVAKIKAKNPSVVYYGGIYYAGALLARQLKNAGVSAVFMGGDGIFDPAFVSKAGATRASGAAATNLGYAIDQMPGGLSFRSRYKAMFGHAERSSYDAYAYDAAQSVLEAIITVVDGHGTSALLGSGGRGLVRAEVAKSAFHGVTGSIGFNSVGDTKYPAVSVYRVKNGAWRECALVGTPVVMPAPTSGVAFTASGTLRPHHTSGTDVAKLRFWRLEGSSWVLHKTVWAKASNSGVFTKYSVHVKLTGPGSWRVSAEHADAQHPAMRSLLRRFTLK